MMFGSERRFLNKELAEHALAQDAAFENDTEQYYRHQARAERYAERADRKHQRHLTKEMKQLKREGLEMRMAEEAMNRGDAAGFAHHQYKAARYHNRAGRTYAKKHYPAPEGHSHHSNPTFRGDMPTAGCAHEEMTPYAFGGVPPLGRTPFDHGTVSPYSLSGMGGTMSSMSTVTTLPSAPMMAGPMGSFGGYSEMVEGGPTPYYSAPIVTEDIPMGGAVPGEIRL